MLSDPLARPRYGRSLSITAVTFASAGAFSTYQRGGGWPGAPVSKPSATPFAAAGKEVNARKSASPAARSIRIGASRMRRMTSLGYNAVKVQDQVGARADFAGRSSHRPG